MCAGAGVQQGRIIGGGKGGAIGCMQPHLNFSVFHRIFISFC